MKVICRNNESVISMQYSPKEGTVLPITVYTQWNLREARRLVAVRHTIFGVVYVVEALVMVLIYLRKRKK